MSDTNVTISADDIREDMNSNPNVPLNKLESVDLQIQEALGNIPRANYELKPIKFKFRKQKGSTDPARDPIDVALPMPNINGIINAMSADNAEEATKIQNYILDLVHSDIQAAARSQVEGNEEGSEPVNFQGDFDFQKLTLAYLAEHYRDDERKTTLSKEVFTEFGRDYSETMIGDGMAPKAVATATDLLTRKFFTIKTNKKVIAKLLTYLDIWVTKSKNAENYEEVYEYLKKKGNNYINADQDELLNQI